MAEKSIFEYKVSPFLQAGAIIAVILVFNLGSFLIGKTGLVDVDAGTPWLISSSFTLFFAIFNSVLSLSTDNQNQYWSQSIMAYGLVVVVGAGIAFLVSGTNMDAVGTYKWLYVVFTIGYILFLSIIRTMRKIVLLAQKQDKRLRGEE